MILTLDKMKENVLTEREAILFLLVKKNVASQRKISDALGISTETLKKMIDKATLIVEKSA